jgi:protein-S-isoprenylcysteine O-methyltransferase Ste14
MNTRIPPPVIVVLLTALMWLLNTGRRSAGFEFAPQPILAIALAAVALLLMLAAAAQMFIAKTTVNPLRPERATRLITTGVFAYSRNPIYLADLLLLTALALWLGNLENIVLRGVFVWYINRFQIAPEEKALTKLFGAGFEQYCARVRRWV